MPDCDPEDAEPTVEPPRDAETDEPDVLFAELLPDAEAPVDEPEWPLTEAATAGVPGDAGTAEADPSPASAADGTLMANAPVRVVTNNADFSRTTLNLSLSRLCFL